MKTLYCWRCNMDVPMLDETDYAIVSELYSGAMRGTKDFRELHKLPLNAISIEERFSPVCKAYFKMTGFEESNANAVMHHRISLYGEACPQCAKPFRSPQASFCAACGFIKTE